MSLAGRHLSHRLAVEYGTGGRFGWQSADVTVLFDRPDIQEFLLDTSRLKELLQLTKETDSFYLQKRNISREYDPVGQYAFESWQMHFNDEIRSRYESLHEDLLYTSERQHFEDAVQAFTKISQLFNEIGE